MNKLLSWIEKKNAESSALVICFGLLFVYFILQSPLYSPDTCSYLKGDIYRLPGYVIYLNVLEAIFGASYDVVAVGLHLLVGFMGIWIIYKNFVSYFNLKNIAKLLFLSVLLFPYFPPLLTANNLTSEGLAYPLYLALISFTLDFLFRNKRKRIIPLAAVFILLILTRGQFIVFIPIFIFIMILGMKKHIFKLRNLSLLILIISLPFLSGLMDSTYRKINHGFFEKTPFSYVNAISLPLFVSQKTDGDLMSTQAHKTLFTITYKKIDNLDLLSSKVEGTAMDKYLLFHDNFPAICNQNIHKQGRAYFRKHDKTFLKDFILIEKACKEMFPVLLKANFKEWGRLYLTSIIFGLGSLWVLLLALIIFVASLFSILKKYSKETVFLFFATSLILSNAMITALATHSIQRYLFYNYFLGFIVVILCLRKIYHFYESRTIRGNAMP